MGCLLALLALISPRLVLIILWIFDDIIGKAIDSTILCVLGFLFLPWTMLTYVAFWDWGSGRHVYGFEWVFVFVAVLIDLGAFDQARRRREAY